LVQETRPPSEMNEEKLRSSDCVPCNKQFGPGLAVGVIEIKSISLISPVGKSRFKADEA